MTSVKSSPETVRESTEKSRELLRHSKEDVSKLREKITEASMADLEELSRLILQDTVKPTEEVKGIIRSRFDTLKKDVEASGDTDAHLDQLAAKLRSLSILLDLKANQSEKGERNIVGQAIASPLRQLSELLKRVPGVGGVLSDITNVSANGLESFLTRRGMEKAMYRMLGGSTIVSSFFLAPLKLIPGIDPNAILKPLQTLAGRKLLKFEIEEALRKERLVGETLTLTDEEISVGDYERFEEKKKAGATLSSLLRTYLQAARELQAKEGRLSEPILCSLADILSAEKVTERLKAAEVSGAKERLSKLWNGAMVTVGTENKAERKGDAWQLTVTKETSERPESPTGKLLLEAMQKLPSASVITIRPSGKTTEIHLGKKEIALPVNIPFDEKLEDVMSAIHHPRVSTVIIGGQELPTDKPRARYESGAEGVLRFNGHSDVIGALTRGLTGMEAALDAATQRIDFELNTQGEWEVPEPIDISKKQKSPKKKTK